MVNGKWLNGLMASDFWLPASNQHSIEIIITFINKV